MLGNHSAAQGQARGALASVHSDPIPFGTLGPEEKPRLRTLIVFAHPDDETVGMGATLGTFAGAHFLCVTDGSPDDLTDARRAGCSSREAYQALRSEELRSAVRAAGHDPAHLSYLDFGDQHASEALAAVTRAVETAFRTLAPEYVVTHPYEGGHPDHDATAFAVHAAAARLREGGKTPPRLIEMTSYHSR